MQIMKIYMRWKENKQNLIKWMEDRIARVSQLAAQNNGICGNTEGW